MFPLITLHGQKASCCVTEATEQQCQSFVLPPLTRWHEAHSCQGPPTITSPCVCSRQLSQSRHLPHPAVGTLMMQSAPSYSRPAGKWRPSRLPLTLP